MNTAPTNFDHPGDLVIDAFGTFLGKRSGKLDLLIRRGAERFPVEVKFTSGPPRINHRVQLGGYAMLLEDEFGVPVTRGFIVCLPDDAITPVLIDGPLRDTVTSVVTAIREMIIHERCPPAYPLSACCQDCEYRNFCGDTV
jgi:CRISPR-associated exonuclease Cas4